MKGYMVLVVVPAVMILGLLALADPARVGLGSSPSVFFQEFRVHARRYWFQPDEIRVKAGARVRIIISYDDNVEYGFTIPELNLTAPRTAADKAMIEFSPQRPGRYEFRPSIQSGLGHDRMVGTLIVE